MDPHWFTCFTRGDESSPPCKRVADTSRLRCGRPSPLCCSVRCLRGFPPLLWIYVVVSVIPLLLLSVRCSIFFSLLLSWLPFTDVVVRLLYSLLCYSSFLNASLVGAVFTVSGRRFQGSTTLTVNEYFLVSVRAYCTARRIRIQRFSNYGFMVKNLKKFTAVIF